MIGTTLSHYRITDELGRGGMGIVYKAEDTKLNRTVAIKVLPAAALSSEDDRARFFREAQAAAQVHHANIATVFAVDEAELDGEKRPFIAMEYIDGETLSDRIAKGPLKLKDAVGFAIQIARALETAHEKNIVHRDMKGGNVMITRKGEAKVLDFGLAKTSQSTKLTRLGSTLGTIAYMSPEQARGEEVDKRADIWALGVVLYEMVSGRLPFPAEYEQAAVYGILNETPEPLTAIRTGVPMALEWIVNKCLAKRAEDRYQSAADLIVDLRNVDVESGSGTSRSTVSTTTRGAAQSVAMPMSSAAPVRRRSVNWHVAAAALLLGALLASAYFYLSQPIPELKPLNRVEISLPGFSTVAFPALSPTREYMVFAGINGEGAGGVFVREMGSGTIRMIAQSENLGEREIRFSPTGDRLAMTVGSNDGVFLVDVPNGIPERLTETGRFSFWINNEEIIVSDDREGGGGGILRVRTDTGEMIPLEISASALGAGYGNIPKTLIPGTERVFGHQLRRLASGNIDPNDPVDLFSLDMKSGSLEIIVNNAINPEFVHGGFLIYQIGTDTGELVWRPIDERTGRPTGQQRDLFSGDARPFWSEYFVDQTGDLIFVDLIRNAEADPLLWEANLESRQIRGIPVRLTGQQVPVDVSYSPDGSALVFTGGRENGSGNIYTYDLSRDQQIQYTYDDSSGAARYTADGRALVVSTEARGQVSLATFPVGNVAGAETLRIDAGNAEFSRDGRWMSFIAGPDSNRPRLVLEDLRSGALSVLDSTSTLPLMAEFSPDGRYIAYMTDPSRFSDIIVHAVSGRQRVVVPGIAGQIPKWGPDGNYLYYANRDGIYRLPVQTDPSFSVVGVPEQVLSVLFLASFDLDSAGSRIVVSAASTGFVGDLETSASRLIWLQNLSDEFKRQSER